MTRPKIETEVQKLKAKKPKFFLLILNFVILCGCLSTTLIYFPYKVEIHLLKFMRSPSGNPLIEASTSECAEYMSTRSKNLQLNLSSLNLIT